MSPANNANLLFNLLFYSINLRYSYNYFYDFEHQIIFDECDQDLNKFVKIFKIMKLRKITYLEYVKLLIFEVFEIEINVIDFKKFNEQIKNIFNEFREKGYLTYTTGFFEPYGKENIFIFSLINGLMDLIRTENRNKKEKRKIQTKLLELYYLKFDFNLIHFPSEEELGYYKKNIIYHFKIISRFLLNENNYNNEQVKKLIEFLDSFFSNNSYFLYDLNVSYYDFYKIYFQAVLLLSFDFDKVDNFYLTSKIYAITPKFINIFDSIFPKNKLNKFRLSNLKYLENIKLADLKETIDIDQEESNYIIKNPYEYYYKNITISEIDELNTLEKDQMNIKKNINEYFKHEDFDLFNSNNNELISTAIRDQNLINDKKIKIYEKLYNKIESLEKNIDLKKEEQQKLFDLYNFISRIKRDLKYDVEETFNLQLTETIEKVIGEANPDVLDLILFGDLKLKLRNYPNEFSKLSKIIDLGNKSEKKLDLYRKDFDNTSFETEEICDECGKPLAIRKGISSFFYGCTDFPKCRFTREVEKIEFLEKRIYEKNKALRALDKLKILVGEKYGDKKTNEETLNEEKINAISSFDFSNTKIDIINYLYFEISSSTFYSNFKKLSRVEIEDRMEKLKTNKLYDWTYTLGLSKYLLDYYEINQENLFKDKTSIDWTFIYVLLTKSLENLIANLIEYKTSLNNDSNTLMIKKNNQFKSINLKVDRWREGLTINDFRYILERNFNTNNVHYNDLSNRIKVLLQDDRNKYLHHNSLIGFNNLKNIYFVKIFELIYYVLTEV